MTEQKKRKKKVKKRFIAVNVWRKSFGPVAVAAVFDIYSQKFNIPLAEAKKMNFTDCVDSLRKLEYENYIPHSQR